MMGIILRCKNLLLCLKLTFQEIPDKNIYGVLKGDFRGFGCPNDTKTPCWLKLCLQVTRPASLGLHCSTVWLTGLEQVGEGTTTEVRWSISLSHKGNGFLSKLIEKIDLIRTILLNIFPLFTKCSEFNHR